ncbi:methionyl-tRNA formyltransferase [Candidatus Deianiraea vastatrix]|uniref:methionyl-tRNA formyltransferase n=1 Tax=Candidatus Deianiraea vastatrix TaxID=2163644 RepID=A0A5B8XCL9_9RICK|nr:methionyl-tRNA formyltransferase [Candidatus Deianiraea vastatrix]QED23098.1 Methionyl-tRNA formyltransferase [Candidatus Deianiraea vastatrix]
MKIVFASTGEIGSQILRGLVASCHEVVAVYTSPPKEAGRGQKFVYNPVWHVANEFKIPVYTPQNFKTEDVKDEFLKIEHDIAVVFSYGFLLPDWFIFGKFQAINLHPSALPLYRGAAPVERCIENGDKYTEICTILMTKALDAGDIIEKMPINIDENWTSDDIFDQVKTHGAGIILKSLDKVKDANFATKPQESGHTYAKKIDKSELLLNLSDSCIRNFNKIRAFTTHGYCYIVHSGERIKIISAKMEKCDVKSDKIATIGQNFELYCNDGVILPQIVQRQGKNQVKIDDFLRGWRL